MNYISVKPKQKCKTVISILTAIILTLCFGFVFVGCSDYISYEDTVKLAKEDYACKSILWVGHVYNDRGNPLCGDADLPPDGGRGVVGLDKNGNEIYILFPTHITSGYKPTKRKWPLDYSMKQIISFAGQYGYQFADGIDGRVAEYLADNAEDLRAYSAYSHIKDVAYGEVYFKSLGGTFYDSLDIKLVFAFRHLVDEDTWYDYIIGQIDGKLMIMEIVCNDTHNPNLYTYERNKQDSES